MMNDDCNVPHIPCSHTPIYRCSYPDHVDQWNRCGVLVIDPKARSKRYFDRIATHGELQKGKSSPRLKQWENSSHRTGGACGLRAQYVIACKCTRGMRRRSTDRKLHLTLHILVYICTVCSMYSTYIHCLTRVSANSNHRTMLLHQNKYTASTADVVMVMKFWWKLNVLHLC